MSLLSGRPDFSDPIQADIYELLCMDSLGIDSLSEKLELEATIIINALALMEIEGHVTASGGLYRIV
jgi:predicted Rossmann fold nucleotide-binding protein DprA/Smf involved in DNA uptake